MARPLLVLCGMRSLALLVVVLALPAVAEAGDGYYLGLGAGNGAAIEGSLASRYDGSDLGSGRFMLGRRWDNDLALEAAYFGTDLRGADGAAYESSALGLDLKYHLPLLLGFELYVKGGVHLDRIERAGDGAGMANGRGYGYGVGLLWAFRALQVVEAGVWLDLGKQVTTFDMADGSEDSAEMRMIMVGFSIGTGI